MKFIIDFGVCILLMAILTHCLPSIVKNARKGQFIILKEASASNWGRAWTPPGNNK